MPSIKYKKKTYAGATFPVLEMTKAEYDALSEAKKMDGTVYMITDDTGGWEAEKSVYDNSTSGLAATNVQDALDELSSSTIYQSSYTLSSFNANNQTIYSGASVTLPKGKYVITCNGYISGCYSGQRQGYTVTTSNTAGAFNPEMYSLVLQGSTTVANQYYSVSGIVAINSQTTFYAMVFNGNTTTSCVTCLKAIKIA